MPDTKPVLVLHLAVGGEPLSFGLPTDSSDEFADRLPQLAKTGTVESVSTKNGGQVTVNFAHVAVAYVEDRNRKGTFGVHP